MENTNIYDEWNILKNEINIKYIDFFPKEREVWICTLGKNIGYEQNGSGCEFIRPCLVLKKFNNQMFWIVPLSSKQKDYDFYFNFMDNDNRNVSMILSQLRLISVNRFERKMYDLELVIYNDVKNKIKDLLT